MKKGIVIFFTAIFIVLIVEIIVYGSLGDKLNYQTIQVVDDTDMSKSTVTCEQHYLEVISTVSLYEEFVSDCQVTKELNYDEKYFQENVFVVYNYNDLQKHQPKNFYDYYFSVNNKEVIKVVFERSLSFSKETTWNIYLIEVPKDKIGSYEVIIG
jgi:hypothetical protein